MKEMLIKMETEMKPILELVNMAKDMNPPDFGSLADWAYEQREKMQQQNRTKSRNHDHDPLDGFDVL